VQNHNNVPKDIKAKSAPFHSEMHVILASRSTHFFLSSCVRPVCQVFRPGRSSNLQRRLVFLSLYKHHHLLHQAAISFLPSVLSHLDASFPVTAWIFLFVLIPRSTVRKLRAGSLRDVSESLRNFTFKHPFQRFVCQFYNSWISCHYVYRVN